MTIGEWIDQRERPIPRKFRRSLGAGGPVSLRALIGAAEQEVSKCAPHTPRDREAAFRLLAADAYVTFACVLAVTEGGDAGTLREAARQVARGWWERLR